MNPVKEVIVEDLFARLQKSPFFFVVDYSKTTVPEFNEVRGKLRQIGAKLTVAKNSYVRIAANKVGMPEDVTKGLLGQTAIVTGAEDMAGAAKILKEFNTTSKKLSTKGGVVDGAFVDEAWIKRIADLPSRPQLLAILLGTLNAPASALARVLQAKVDKENGEPAA
jgi:large subunit ribosomal protein L10